MCSVRSIVARIAVLLLAVSALGLCPACSTTAKQRVPFPAQDVELTRSELTRIYITQTKQAAGAPRKIRVYEDERKVGSISRRGYLCWERSPGRSLVRVIYEGPKLDEGEAEGLLDLVCAPGEVHYYAISLQKGDRKPVVARLDAEEGRRLIGNRKPPKVE